VRQLSEHDYFINNETRHSPSEGEWTVTALAPLTRDSDTIGIIEVTVDNSGRAQQLNRLRHMAFGALTTLLAPIFGVVGFSISRTLQKHRNAQQALALSKRQHRQLLDDAPDSMVIHNLDKVIYVNEAAVALHGAGSKEDLLGIDPIELVPEEKRAEVADHRRKAITRGEIRTSEMLGRRRLDGQVVETDTIGIPINWDGQPCILIQSGDMIAQRTAQREIAE
jgi:PAS domain S-box-containing protein